MPRQAPRSSQPHDHQIMTAERWRSLLFNHIPLLGSGVRYLAVRQLIRRSLAGDPSSVRVLADGLSLPPETSAASKIKSFILDFTDPNAITVLWEVWAKTRQDPLKDVLTHLNQLALSSSHAYVLSHIALRSEFAIRSYGPEIVDPIVDLLQDRNAAIAASAFSLAASLKNPVAIDHLGALWAQSRSPLLADAISRAGYQARKPAAVKILMALKWHRPDLVLHTGSDGVQPLLDACHDPDEYISTQAKTCLLNLQDQGAVNELCRLWMVNRSPILESAILKAKYAAEKPLSVKILIQLKTGRMDQTSQIPPDGLDSLIAASTDQDSTVSANARTVMGTLKIPATIEAFCQHVIDSQDPLLLQTAIQANYTPRSLEKCTLFFFLTGQLDRYESLDFDRRMMQAVYEVASPSLKARIARQVQVSGKTEDLIILGDLEIQRKTRLVNSQEIELMVRLLSQNHEWDRLWKMAFEVPLTWSISIFRTLTNADWLPSTESEAAVFRHLSNLAKQKVLDDPDEFERALPLALKRATLRVPGRINSLAFAADRSILAIGTGERKLGLWDFQAGAMKRVLSGFNHSIGQIAFCGEHLVCGQRSNQNALCSIYAWENDQSYLLGSHVGLVASLIPVNETQILSTGRDGKAVLWDLTGRKTLSTTELPFWPRAAAVSPNRHLVALAYESLALASLPDLTLLPHLMTNTRQSGVHAGPARSIAFTPGGDGIVVGQFNGQVVYYEIKDSLRLIRKKLVTNHNQPVIGLQFIPNHPMLVSCTTVGLIRFTAWPSQENIGNGISTGLPITSLQISADGSFMAIGTRDARIILFDLRVRDLPSIFATPVAQVTPVQAAAITSLLEEKDLVPALQNSLSILMELIQQRFQFNIEIEEAPVIQRGEFDVIID